MNKFKIGTSWILLEFRPISWLVLRTDYVTFCSLENIRRLVVQNGHALVLCIFIYESIWIPRKKSQDWALSLPEHFCHLFGSSLLRSVLRLAEIPFCVCISIRIPKTVSFIERSNSRFFVSSGIFTRQNLWFWTAVLKTRYQICQEKSEFRNDTPIEMQKSLVKRTPTRAFERPRHQVVDAGRLLRASLK